MKRYICIIMAGALALSCMKTQEQAEPVTTAEAPEIATISPHQVKVLFSEDMVALIEAGGDIATKAPGLGSLMEELGIESMERIFPYAGEFEERTRREGLHRFYKVKYKADVPATKAMDSFGSIPGVELCEPVHKIAKRVAFNDPKFSLQWHYVNTRYPGADIHVQEVWNNYTVGSNNVIVCVVDEPVDPSHPDLQANLWNDGNGHTGYNFARGNYDLTILPESGEGDSGHGTHVAGTISAVNNNGVGLCGLAGGDYANGIQGVLLQSAAIFSGTAYADDDETCNAIKWGADHGALISQNSWGLYADRNGDGRVSSSELSYFKSLTIDEFTKAAVNYFIKYAGCDNAGNQLPDSPMKGGLVIFASGNEDIDYDPYCAYEPVIAVGAFGTTGAKASYSNYGDWVDIAAPGGEGETSSNSIWSTLPQYIASTDYRGNPIVENTSWYGGQYWAGTSMACPHVSGVAALLISYFGGPGFTADMCKAYLIEGADADFLAGSSKRIGRKLNALGAFEYGIQSSGGGVNRVTISLSQNIPAEIHAHESVSVTVSATSSAGNPVTLSLQNAPSGVSITDGTLKIDGPTSTSGAHSFSIKATDNEGTSATKVINYTILQNHAPTTRGRIDDMLFPSMDVKTVSLSSLFSDPDGETPTYTATVSNAELVSASVSYGTLTVKPLSYGDASVTVTATDLLGLSTSLEFKLVIYDPSKPAQTYPLQVKDEVNVRIPTEDQRKARIRISTTSGALVFDSEYFMNVLNPAKIDMSKCAPGYYAVAVTYSGKTYTSRVVKL